MTGNINHSRSFPDMFKKFPSTRTLSFTEIPDAVRIWTRTERKAWLLSFFITGCMLYASRTVMPVCSVAISQEFQWTKTQTGIMLSAFFWGYMSTQVIGGMVADHYGGELIICLSIIGWSWLTLVTPYIIRFTANPYFGSPLIYAVSIRALTGCFQGLHYPSITSIFSRRISEYERAFSYCFATSGTHLGTLLSGILGSLLNEYYGWSASFYFIGCFSLLWLFFYYFFMLDRHDLAIFKADTVNREPKPQLKWTVLFTKMPFWSILIGNFCSGWMFFILLSWLPTYFHENFPEAKSWVFNVVPWLLSLPVQCLSGYFSDSLIFKGYSTTFVRKLMQTIAFCGSAFFLLILGRTTDFHLALFCMTATITFYSFHFSGISVNVQDIAPGFAGSVFGVVNMAGVAPGFIGVYVTGYILDQTNSWEIVFNLSAFLLLFGCIIFLIFGTGKKVI